MIYAVGKRRKDILEFLLNEGFDINLTNTRNGETAIFHAIHYNYEDIVDVLLKYNANLNVISALNLTPLYTAIYRNKPNIVKKCLLNGAKFDLSEYNKASSKQPLLPKWQDLHLSVKQVLLVNMGKIFFI